jgi:agmatine/peptidylarginine deiminase
MKKISFLILLSIAILNFGQLYAQVENNLPNNGLTHRMSGSEKLFVNDYSPNLLTTTPPVGPVRNIAEFEPAEAVIIAYASGFGLPYSVIKDLALTGNVIVACPSSNQATALNLLNTNGVNTSVCTFLTTPLNSWWTRDYSGWFIADSSNHVQVVDFTYNRPRPSDDAVTALEAAQLGITMYGMDLTTTGGNWMCDGYNKAISTVLVNEENTSLTQTQIQQKVLSYLGISDYMIRPDAQGQYIEHIDCWGKLLAPDKILVDSVPSTDAQYSMYEAAAAYFASTNCAYGYPYKVYRPLISGSSETNAEPYSNSFIFNNRVFVPIVGFSAAHDTAALQCYRKAMPGYIVKGYYTSSSSAQAWLGTDALHCRTHEIADRSMLYIEHLPLHGLITSYTGYDINAKVVSYANHTIAANYPIVKYKVNHSGQWDSLTMAYVSYLNYKATIPTQNSGDTIFYYIKAKDNTGKTAYHALMGQADPHFFIAAGTNVEIPEIVANPELSFFTYPNPSKGNFTVFLKSNYTGNASLQIYDITGKQVYTENFELANGSSMKRISTDNLTQGVYVIEVKTNSDVMTKQLIIQ